MRFVHEIAHVWNAFAETSFCSFLCIIPTFALGRPSRRYAIYEYDGILYVALFATFEAENTIVPWPEALTRLSKARTLSLIHI